MVISTKVILGYKMFGSSGLMQMTHFMLEAKKGRIAKWHVFVSA